MKHQLERIRTKDGETVISEPHCHPGQPLTEFCQSLAVAGENDHAGRDFNRHSNPPTNISMDRDGSIFAGVDS
jgi:hypothetical protein